LNNGNPHLTVKGNYQVFPVEARGIDFLGYVFWHSHILLRKSIKKRFARKVKKYRSYPEKLTLCYASYKGWATHCNSRNLVKKLSNEIKLKQSA
jgi:hypothetical protein